MTSERAHPAEVIRRAAALMRERAEKATPGPWQHMCLGSEGCLVLRKSGTLRERGRGRVARFGQKEWKADHADAEFVAGMSPVVALALAEWLDGEAKLADETVAWDTPSCTHEDPPCACDVTPGWACDRCGDWLGEGGCRCWTAVLKVARAYLGEAETERTEAATAAGEAAE